VRHGARYFPSELTNYGRRDQPCEQDPQNSAKTATKTVAKTPAKTNSATGKICIGVGGWTFAPWRGVFYPQKLTQAKELEYAASRLTSIEINGTYY
jgi:hypothetical protein